MSKARETCWLVAPNGRHYYGIFSFRRENYGMPVYRVCAFFGPITGRQMCWLFRPQNYQIMPIARVCGAGVGRHPKKIVPYTGDSAELVKMGKSKRHTFVSSVLWNGPHQFCSWPTRTAYRHSMVGCHCMTTTEMLFLLLNWGFCHLLYFLRSRRPK